MGEQNGQPEEFEPLKNVGQGPLAVDSTVGLAELNGKEIPVLGLAHDTGFTSVLLTPAHCRALAANLIKHADRAEAPLDTYGPEALRGLPPLGGAR